jgi:teichuronic acid biosynthesis glycosyltransferase TuaG
MNYYITSCCFGDKFKHIVPHWSKRIYEKCTNTKITLWTEDNCKITIPKQYAWWDIIRLENNLTLLTKPVVHIDLDIIVEKDIAPIVDLPYDIIISTEIGGNKAYPPECSSRLGFGVCSGFYVLKPSCNEFIRKIYESMVCRKYNNYSDQVTLMNTIVTSKYEITEEVCQLNGQKYTNKIIHIDGIQICVLDFNIITRDPIVDNGQFANHINIDNVGSVGNFIRYFYEPLDKLPLTCRCGKSHLGDISICKHINLRTRISILMPVYNGIEFMDESVGSVLSQTYSGWELIIGVNGHPENSAVYKRALHYESKSKSIKVLDLHQIKGKSNALNEMIKYCSYDHVALLDVDDIWHPQKLESQVPLLSNYDVVGTRCLYFGERDGSGPSIPTGDISKYDFLIANPIINSSSIIHKSMCYWDSKFDGVEDYDLWLKLRSQKRRFYNCDQLLVKHRLHKASAFNANGNHKLVDALINKYRRK